LLWAASEPYENKFYACRSGKVDPQGKKSLILLHRIITNAPAALHVDHINGDGLDNRDENLRLVTMSQNMRNRGKNSKSSSGFKGVCWDWNAQNWRASVGINGKVINLGGYSTREEAFAKACEAREKYHGEYARHS
jgi:hypothetical protein